MAETTRLIPRRLLAAIAAATPLASRAQTDGPQGFYAGRAVTVTVG